MKLQIINYTKELKGKTILNHVNMELESGHVYGLFGRNGSGKTMLFRAITTLIHPNEGDIKIDGVSIIQNDFDLSQIGLLIEDPGFYSHLSGFDNLMMLYSINHKKNPEHIYSILKKVGLENAAKKHFREYSLGMKQRLRIAQAIMENQKIIILDEPTNGIDEDGMKDVYKIIQDEKNDGKLVLLASHNKDDLFMLCDYIYEIREGKVNLSHGGITDD